MQWVQAFFALKEGIFFMTRFMVVANWKMYKTVKQEQAFWADFGEQLAMRVQQAHVKLIICPSHVSLYHLCNHKYDTDIFVGSQDCSAYPAGAYTGQISAQTLRELGCSYVIIGHSERRRYNHETDQDVAQKMLRALEAGLTPIVCIGETIEEKDAGKTRAVLAKQCEQIISARRHLTATPEIVVAYEPIWAIGTGVMPEIKELEELFSWLYTQLGVTLLYGGSVSSKTIKQLNPIPYLGGLLIGKASLDYTELAEIISLCARS